MGLGYKSFLGENFKGSWFQVVLMSLRKHHWVPTVSTGVYKASHCVTKDRLKCVSVLTRKKSKCLYAIKLHITLLINSII